MGDPVSSGTSASFARPGGNVTGSTLYGFELAAKKVEILKQALPRLNKVAVFVNPANAGSQYQVKAMRDAADSLSLQLQVLEVRSPGDLDAAFAVAKQGAAGALVVALDTLFRANASQIAERAIAQRLPSVGTTEFAAAGGMIGYGPDTMALYRHAAYFVDRLLKGARVADLPIERPTKLDLLINLKTAKALGITIPKETLLRATDVIQ
jgi:putative ABC transport system substrate-binding protein